MPTLMGEKTEGERFAGADHTYTIETVMKDGQALQAGTSHYLGQNFSKTYDIKFTNKENKLEHVYQTSVGMSTRIIGAIIMSHADNNGLVLPFGVAPTQIALIPVAFDKNPEVLEKMREFKQKLSSKYRIHLDESNDSFGYKVSEQEINGTPICLVLGPKDLANNTITLIPRNTSEKINVSLDRVCGQLDDYINQYQKGLFDVAKKRLDDSIVEVQTYDELVKAVNNKKICLAPWGGSAEDEKKLKLQSGGITPRCIKCEVENMKCFYTNKPAKYLVYFGRAY
ncbi:MAG: hypothetical protein K2M43_01640 [Mycoplasmoidaceae bacterium]|nr:hypothetical protein [Mycoplasmoidaceae bacterium]